MSAPTDRPAATSVRVHMHSRDLAYQLSIDLTPGAQRRLSIADIIAGALTVAAEHRDELLDAIVKEEKATP